MKSIGLRLCGHLLIGLAISTPTLSILAVEPDPPVVIFNVDLALPAIPASGDGTGIAVCIDEISGLLMAGCDNAIGPEGPAGPQGEKGPQGIPGEDGASCYVEDNLDGTATINCGDNSTVIGE